MKKTLKLYVVSQNKMRVTFQIIEQSHRRDEFGVGGSRFNASNGVILHSFSSPCLGKDEFYVRGSNKRSDQQLMVAYWDSWELIAAAVDEYNKFEFEEIEK